MSTNPYAAPRAQVADHTPVARGNFLPAGRTVAAGNGWLWITAAWSLFRARAGLLIGMFVVAALAMLVLTFVPLIGPIAQSLLWPVFVAGFVIVCGKIEDGEGVQFGELFAGFSRHPGKLIAAGLIGMLVSVLIALAAVAVMGTAFFADMNAGMTPARLMSLLVALWFAPPLIVFHDMGAWEAMKASFFGGLKNMLPFLLYGVVLTVACAIATIPAMLGWLVLGPVIGASIYTSYRDIYFSDPGTAGDPE